MPKLLPEVTHKEMKEYSRYIESKTQNYYTRINFDGLRGDHKTGALNLLDLNEWKMLQSLSICIIDAL